MSFPFYKQLDAMDCGPSCLRMIAKYYGKSYTLQGLREKCFITREGVSLMGISDAAEKIGFHTLGIRLDFKKLSEEAPLPCIVHWKQNHFIVVYKIKNKELKVGDKVVPFKKTIGTTFINFENYNTRTGLSLKENGFLYVLEVKSYYYSLGTTPYDLSGDFFMEDDMKGMNIQLEFEFT